MYTLKLVAEIIEDFKGLIVTKLVFLFAILILSVSNTYAAFPVNEPPATTAAASQQLTAVNTSNGLVHESFSETRNHLPASAPAVHAKRTGLGITIAIASFACGVAALFVAGIPLGLLAIALGVIAISIDSKMQGFAIFGSLLGAAAIIITLISQASTG